MKKSETKSQVMKGENVEKNMCKTLREAKTHDKFNLIISMNNQVLHEKKKNLHFL